MNWFKKLLRPWVLYDHITYILQVLSDNISILKAQEIMHEARNRDIWNAIQALQDKNSSSNKKCTQPCKASPKRVLDPVAKPKHHTKDQIKSAVRKAAQDTK